jgi:uncharacterized protein (TIGR02118 family)
MYKVVGLIRRKDDVSREEFVRYWEEEHVPKVLELPAVRKYTIAPAISSTAPYDGIAELYYDSVEDIKKGDDTEAMRRIKEDEETFIAESTFFVAEERVQYDETA